MRQLHDRFADQFRATVAEHFTEGVIDKNDSTLQIAARDTHYGLIDNGAQTFFRDAQRFFGPFSFQPKGELAGNSEAQTELLLGENMPPVVIDHEFPDQFSLRDQRKKCGRADTFSADR